MLGVSPLQVKKKMEKSHHLHMNWFLILYTLVIISLYKKVENLLNFLKITGYLKNHWTKLGLFEHISMHFFAESNQI